MEIDSGDWIENLFLVGAGVSGSGAAFGGGDEEGAGVVRGGPGVADLGGAVKFSEGLEDPIVGGELLFAVIKPEGAVAVRTQLKSGVPPVLTLGNHETLPLVSCPTNKGLFVAIKMARRQGAANEHIRCDT